MFILHLRIIVILLLIISSLINVWLIMLPSPCCTRRRVLSLRYRYNPFSRLYGMFPILLLSVLMSRYRTENGAYKWSAYFSVYETTFCPRRPSLTFPSFLPPVHRAQMILVHFTDYHFDIHKHETTIYYFVTEFITDHELNVKLVMNTAKG